MVRKYGELGGRWFGPEDFGVLKAGEVEEKREMGDEKRENGDKI